MRSFFVSTPLHLIWLLAVWVTCAPPVQSAGANAVYNGVFSESQSPWEVEYRKFEEMLRSFTIFAGADEQELQQAYAIARELPDLAARHHKGDTEYLVLSYHALSMVHGSGLDPIERGEEYLKRALALREEASDYDRLKVANGATLVAVYAVSVTHDKEKALRHLSHARDLVRADIEETGEAREHLEAMIDIVGWLIAAYELTAEAEAPDGRGQIHYRAKRLSLHEERVALLERSYGERDQRLASPLWGLAGVQSEGEHHLEAIRTFQRLYSLVREQYGDEHFLVVGVLRDMAKAYHGFGPLAGLSREEDPKDEDHFAALSRDDRLAMADAMLAMGKEAESESNLDLAMGFYIGVVHTLAHDFPLKQSELTFAAERLRTLLVEKGEVDDAIAVEQWLAALLAKP